MWSKLTSPNGWSQRIIFLLVGIVCGYVLPRIDFLNFLALPLGATALPKDVWLPGLATIISIIVLIYQIQRTKYTLSLDVIHRINDRFDAPRFRKIRKQAAASLKANSPGYEVAEVLDFLDEIGFLVCDRNAIDRRTAWNMFYYWVDGYCTNAKNYIDVTQTIEGTTVWANIKTLYDELKRIEQSEDPDSESDKEFLDRESALEC